MTIPGGVTRFPNGVGTVAEGNTLGKMAQPDPSQFQTYWADFIDYLGPVGAVNDTVNNWTSSGDSNQGIIYQDQIGGEGIVGVAGGTVIDTDAYLIRTPLNMFALLMGRELWFKTAVQSATSGNADYIVGLADEADLEPADGIFFRHQGTGRIWNLVLREGLIETVSPDIDLTDIFRWDFGFYWDGLETVTYFLNDVQIGSIPVTEDLLPSPSVVPMFGVVAHQAILMQLSLNYIFVAQPRQPL